VATLVSVVATVVFAYSISYMADQPHQGRFYAELSLFAAAMLAIVMAADLLTLFIAWELVGLSSYLLIAFRFQEPDAPPAATKALLVTRLGDLAMLAGLLLLVQAAVSSDIGQVLTAASSGDLNSSVLLIAALLIFAGAAGKSAQWPLQGWLPDAMVAPTPVSALLHSATMVAAGVFLVARLYPLFEAASLALPVVA
jgi:NADH-quinone oxidoreductase subunit L